MDERDEDKKEPPRRITISLNPGLYKLIKSAADKNRRSFGKQVEVAMEHMYSEKHPDLQKALEAAAVRLEMNPNELLGQLIENCEILIRKS